MSQRNSYHLIILLAVFQSSLPQRRIRDGKEVLSDKKYMVYLLRASSAPNQYHAWLCGGAILTKDYVITSAACVQDVRHIYVVPGYKKYVSADDENDECVKQKKKKVILTCVPSTYNLDYNKTELWSKIDVAVIKVESPFDFADKSYETVCSYIPQPIDFNVEKEFPKPGDDVIVFGWGHTNMFRTDKVMVDLNSATLRYASTKVLDEEKCVSYFQRNKELVSIIESSMLCTLDPGNLNDKGELILRSPMAQGCITEAARLRGAIGRMCDNGENAKPSTRKTTTTKTTTIASTTTTPITTIIPTTKEALKKAHRNPTTPSSDESELDSQTVDEDSLDVEVARRRLVYAKRQKSKKAKRQRGLNEVEENDEQKEEGEDMPPTTTSQPADEEETTTLEIITQEEEIQEEEPTIPTTTIQEEEPQKEEPAIPTTTIQEEEPETEEPAIPTTTIQEEEPETEEPAILTTTIQEEETEKEEPAIPTTTIQEEEKQKEDLTTTTQEEEIEKEETTTPATTKQKEESTLPAMTTQQGEVTQGEEKNEIATTTQDQETQTVVEEGEYTPGICQNDHGGPLVAWRGSQEVLVAIATLYKVDNKKECMGPYLFTKTWCNAAFIKCIVDDYKDGTRRSSCNDPEEVGFSINRRYISWVGHRDGPADNEQIQIRHQVPMSAFQPGYL